MWSRKELCGKQELTKATLGLLFLCSLPFNLEVYTAKSLLFSLGPHFP